MSFSFSNVDPGGSQGKQMATITDRRERELRDASSLQRYMQILNTMRGGFVDAMEPERARAADAVSLGSQAQMKALNEDLARRGYSTSGIGFAGRQAIRGGRQATLNENMVKAYETALKNALEMALRQQQLNVQSLLGAPMEQPNRYNAWNLAGRRPSEAASCWCPARW